MYRTGCWLLPSAHVALAHRDNRSCSTSTPLTFQVAIHAFGLGGVLVLQEPTFQVEFFSCSPPSALVVSWLPQEDFMGQLEILAGPAALATWISCSLHQHWLPLGCLKKISWVSLKSWQDQLPSLHGATTFAGSRVIHFVDNDSATANLVRGYTPNLTRAH